jgi:hypothetical protein
LKVSTPPAHLSAIDPPRRFSRQNRLPRHRRILARRLVSHGELGASVHPRRIPAVRAELRRAPPERRQKLMHLSDAIGAQPNKRLELTPPSVVTLRL